MDPSIFSKRQKNGPLVFFFSCFRSKDLPASDILISARIVPETLLKLPPRGFDGFVERYRR